MGSVLCFWEALRGTPFEWIWNVSRIAKRGSFDIISSKLVGDWRSG